MAKERLTAYSTEELSSEIKRRYMDFRSRNFFPNTSFKQFLSAIGLK